MNIISTISSILEEEGWRVPMKEKTKEKRLNPRTNRIKTFKNIRYLDTDVPPEQRTFKNIPKYSDGTPKVRFQDWLLIKGEKISPESQVNTYGKSEADGKWYGWSHRAVHGFGVGDLIKPGHIGNKYRDERHSIDDEKETFKPYTIKSDKEAQEHAKRFAEEVS